MTYLSIEYHGNPDGNEINQLFDSTGVVDDSVYRDSYHRNSVQLFLT